MKRNLGFFLAIFLVVPGLAYGKDKDAKLDPRLKKIHTIFLKGAFEGIQQVQDNRADIENGSCLKLADNADTADAVVNVSYAPGGREWISSGSIQNPDVALQQVQPYHTALELSVREGSKMKRIWDKHVNLDRAQQAGRPGVLRLLDLLRHDACDGR